MMIMKGGLVMQDEIKIAPIRGPHAQYDTQGLFTLEHPNANNGDTYCANCIIGIYSTRRKALEAAQALGFEEAFAWGYIAEFELDKTYKVDA